MSDSTLTLEVGGLPVTVAVIHHRLEVPMRRLLVDTLGMPFGPQARKLQRLAARFQVRLREVPSGTGVRPEPCLPAHRLTAYLWTLAPRRPEIREKLGRLQDGFDTALLAWHGVNPDEIDGPGNWLARVLASAPLLAQRKAEGLQAENVRLRQALVEATRQETAAPGVEAARARRWVKHSAMTKETFLEMKRLAGAGNSLADIARQLRCSRTAVSLFLDGKYQSQAAQEALAELRRHPT